ncbi:MAG: hypothetical protein DRP50_04730 [Thermotoga sp.]|nr:hypothetical protein [Thermotogota bacterium]RKX54175.1 MAG: hypothetical protein DRP50_04730 [Thermotoga sp.]
MNLIVFAFVINGLSLLMCYLDEKFFKMNKANFYLYNLLGGSVGIFVGKKIFLTPRYPFSYWFFVENGAFYFLSYTILGSLY